MKASTRAFYELAVIRSVTSIASRLDEALDLSALAKDAALAPLHFHRIFRGLMLETPLELHRRLRLERAAYRLAHEQTPITRVALDAGYETHEAFTRTFRDAFGSPPSEFRRTHTHAVPRTGVFPWKLQAASGVHVGTPPDLMSFPTLEGDRTMNVTIETMPELTVFAVRHHGPYNQISNAFAELGKKAAAAGLLGLSGTAMLAVYHDDAEQTPADQLRSDAGLAVPPGTAPVQGLSVFTLPAGTYARTTHTGSYDRLGDTWARLMGGWLPQSGHRVAGSPSFEIYRNHPGNAKTDDLRTDLYVPLR